jgi:molybdopterin-guanine dinucleotide biosynthesis protein A
MLILGGIFVGGRASRMGGIAKGLLPTSEGGVSIVTRTVALLRAEEVTPLLVGAHPAYSGLGLETLTDDPAARGPLAGLLSLLRRARRARVIAVACDMPFLTSGLVRRLLQEQPSAPVLAPRSWDERLQRPLWEPLFARYEASIVLPIAERLAAAGIGKLQVLLEEAGAVPLALDPTDRAALVDWDTPAAAGGFDGRGRA